MLDRQWLQLSWLAEWKEVSSMVAKEHWGCGACLIVSGYNFLGWLSGKKWVVWWQKNWCSLCLVCHLGPFVGKTTCGISVWQPKPSRNHKQRFFKRFGSHKSIKVLVVFPGTVQYRHHNIIASHSLGYWTLQLKYRTSRNQTKNISAGTSPIFSHTCSNFIVTATNDIPTEAWLHPLTSNWSTPIFLLT